MIGFSTRKISTDQKTFKRAFYALNEFAEKNFPSTGRLRYLTLIDVGKDERLVLLGGLYFGKPMQPGIYYAYDDPEMMDSMILGEGAHITGPLILMRNVPKKMHEAFLQEAYKFVDFTLLK